MNLQVESTVVFHRNRLGLFHLEELDFFMVVCQSASGLMTRKVGCNAL